MLHIVNFDNYLIVNNYAKCVSYVNYVNYPKPNKSYNLCKLRESSALHNMSQIAQIMQMSKNMPLTHTIHFRTSIQTMWIMQIVRNVCQLGRLW